MNKSNETKGEFQTNAKISERDHALLQKLVDNGFYMNRSEAVRVAIRKLAEWHGVV